jgi:hypothetical protein
LIVIGGQRLSTRHIRWNFVSSRQDRLEQAKRARVSRAFPKIPGDEEEFIPLPQRRAPGLSGEEANDHNEAGPRLSAAGRLRLACG